MLLAILWWALEPPLAITRLISALVPPGTYDRYLHMVRNWTLNAAFLTVAGLATGLWLPAAGSAASAAIGAWLWWRRRKRRDRAAGVIGAKSRALRDAIVAKLREVARPRPVLRPVPGAA